MDKKINYILTEDYIEHCCDEFSVMTHDNHESELKKFIESELSKCSTDLDALLTYDFLVKLCEKDYREFFEKSRFEYITQLSVKHSPDEIKELSAQYNEYYTEDMEEYGNTRIQVIRCYYCGKPIYKERDCYHISEAGEDYCYENIKEENDIYHTCIGKELIKCGYSEKKIMFMLGPDYNEYSKAIEEDTIGQLEDENGDSYPEIFYTTTEC